MRDIKTFFSLMTLIILVSQEAETVQHGNESGQNVTRNLFEYNLYERNRDRLRGRGIYGDEEEAYPNQYNYIEESNSRKATDGWL